MLRCEQVMSAPHYAHIAHDLVCKARGRECLDDRDCPLWDGANIEGTAPLDREIRESVPTLDVPPDVEGMVPLPRAAADVGDLETAEGASSKEDAPS
jgi:hypothetical protein